MRCYICDKELSEKEVIYNEELKQQEPCTTCLEVALDAAYCDGFSYDEDEIVLLDDSLLYGDSSDVVYRPDKDDE